MSFANQFVDTKACHTKQKQFLEIYDTDEGKNFRTMNLRDDTLFSIDNDPSFINYTNNNLNIKNNTEEDNKYTKDSMINDSKQITDQERRSVISRSSIGNHQVISNRASFQMRYIKKNIDLSDNAQGKLRMNKSLKYSNTKGQEADFYDEELYDQTQTVVTNNKNDNNNTQNQKLSFLIPQVQKKQAKQLSDLNVAIVLMIKKRLIGFYNNFTLSGRRQFLKLESVHRTLNDKSDGYLEQKSRNIFKRLAIQLAHECNKIFSNFFAKVPVMNQQSKLGLVFLLLFIFFNTFFYLLFSIMLVFEDVLTGQQFYIFKTTLIFWSLEIFRKLNTTIHQESVIVTSRKEILLFYIKKIAFFDVLPMFCLFTLLLQQQDSNESHYSATSINYILKFACFIKLKSLQVDFDELEKCLCMMMKRYYIMKLVNLIFKLFIIAHFIACLWYIVAQIDSKFIGESSSWFADTFGSDNTWWKVYLLSIYWALTLMTTGSNTAITVLQTMFTCCIMPFVVIIIGYMLNATGNILEDINASEENKKSDLNIINDYMREKNISMSLQRRVNIYLEYYYEKNYQKLNEETQGVLSKISSELTTLMRKEYFQQILAKIDFLKNNFSQQTLENLATQCEEIFYFPNQVIFQENDFSDSALLMIIEGQVEIYTQNQQDKSTHKTICFLKTGNILGQINFFTGMTRSASARSKGFTKIAKISNQSFLEVIKEHQKDFQTFFSMKDKILLYENYQSMNIKCTACGSFKHLQGSCTLVHFNKEATKDVIKITQSFKQERKPEKRSSKKKSKSLKIISRVFERGVQYLEKMIEENEIFLNENEDESFTDESSQHLLFLESEPSINQQSCMIQTQGQDNKNLLTNNEIYDEDDKKGQRKLSGFDSNSMKIKFDEIEQLNVFNNNNESPIKEYYKNKMNTHMSQSGKEAQMQYENQKSEKKTRQQQNQQDQIQSKIRSQSSSVTKRENSKYRGSIGKVQIEQLIQDESNKKSQGSMTQLDQKKKNKKEKSQRLSKVINKDFSISIDERIKFQQHLTNHTIQFDAVQVNLNQQEMILWYLDKPKDYEFYFPNGNPKFKIAQFKMFQKKKELENIPKQKQNRKNIGKKSVIQAMGRGKQSVIKPFHSQFINV
ncbi:cyclic nucleotide-binding domain protein (macronuclear) [Tetrahymena thermophila SB210]|uniref:Cyclic nucleotide-binding domain protein n=1 Tax=Tetrahymena thermophila (strain SB210) TaxID=312017 RepID=Q23AJ8_TETTS|nr:cyclic nucleotide-binding domain protein [Tetrahymena thermophila SB210]EAR93494.2 cyclic nucleotide-binding domain protein [Tetrahymena thermophila SB210]|eukprot:XP_001013739.2 cyclic nucleotide-binding domain protein [Tetrahymena thermophila SB210]